MSTVTTPLTPGYVVTTVGSPSSDEDAAQILALQGPYNAPLHGLIDVVTNPLNVSPTIQQRMSNFSENIYSLSDYSVLVRLMKVLIGMAGAGQTRARITQARLASIINGANFLELDAFYGAIFGVTRLSSENYLDQGVQINPYTDLGTYDDWSSVRASDSSYRSRIDQFGRAIALGPCADGIVLACEAILQTSCDIIEGWIASDFGIGKYYGQVDTVTNKALTSNVATLTVNNTFSNGSVVIVQGVDSTFNGTYTLTGASPTTISYALTHANISSTAATGIVLDGSSNALSSYTYTALGALTYNGIETGLNLATSLRKAFTIIPHRQITRQEAFALHQVLEILKPLDSVGLVETEGYDVYTDVPIINVDADNWFWHLKESVIPLTQFSDIYAIAETPDSEGYYEILRPPYAEYQGERIVFNEDISVVFGYELSDPTSTTSLPNQVIDSVTFADGTTYYYPPNNAVAGRSQSVISRLVNDAILQGNIYSFPSGTTGLVAPVSDLYVDGISIGDLEASLGELGTSIDSANNDQYYWSTPPQFAENNVVEVVEVRLPAAKEMNFVEMKLATYPHLATLQIRPNSGADWVTVATHLILDSVPSVLSPVPSVVHKNPQHVGSGHWQAWSVSFAATPVSGVRVLLERTTNGTPPVILDPLSPTGQSEYQYSLGIKDMFISYEVNQRSDMLESPVYSVDVLGSAVKWVTREEVPDNALAETGIWRCDPQPSADSVVNFYMDLRNNAGIGQTIDGFFIDPVYTGPHVTVYYSNDLTADLGFFPLSNTLPVVANGTVLSSSGSGIQFQSTAISNLQIDNTTLQFDPNQAWWVGVVFQPNFADVGASGQIIAQLSNDIVLSCQTITGTPSIKLTCDSTTLSVPTNWTAYDLIGVVVSYNPATQMLSMWVNSPVFSPTTTATEASSGPSAYYPTSLYLGAAPGTGLSSNMSIATFLLKQETLDLNEQEIFFGNPTGYTVISEFANSDPTGLTLNSIIRFDPSFINTSNQFGLRGGPGHIGPLLKWTPVIYDFTARKGLLKFSPTAAKFWKFEFTNLIAQNVNAFGPITKNVQFMPSNDFVQSPAIGGVGNQGNAPVGTSALLGLTQGRFFGDQIPNLTLAPAAPVANSPTAAQVATDPLLAASLSQTAWYWQYQQWQPGYVAPRFVVSGYHDYNTQTIQMDSNVGFFCGLNQVIAQRHDFITENASDFYDELFQDSVYLTAGGGWNLG